MIEIAAPGSGKWDISIKSFSMQIKWPLKTKSVKRDKSYFSTVRYKICI